MANFVEKANQLREALARVDRNGDGLLNFDEFKGGLRDLGVKIPDEELVKIWHEASSNDKSKPAGRPSFQGPLPGFEHEEAARSIKKVIKDHPKTPFHSQLVTAFQVGEDAPVSGLDGLHSHKKVGFKTGNSATELALEGGSLTSKNVPKLEQHRRNNLQPASHLQGGFLPTDENPSSPTKSPASIPSAGRNLCDALEAEITSAKHLMSPDPGDYVSAFRAQAQMGCWEKNKQIDLSLAGPRLLKQLQEQQARLEKYASGKDARHVDYKVFQLGVKEAGLIIGDEDARRLWVAAGGSLGRHGQVSGEIDLSRLLNGLASIDNSQREFGKKSMLQQGYRPHMQSSLSKGFEVESTTEETYDHDRIGPMRRAAVVSRPPDTPGFLEHGEDDAHENLGSQTSSMRGSPASKGGDQTRWTKLEQTVRAGLRSSTSHPILHEAFGVTSADSRGRKLNYNQLKDALNTCGFTMSSNDFEVLWRRVDKGCDGEISYTDVMTSFQVHTNETGRALPHLDSNGGDKSERRRLWNASTGDGGWEGIETEEEIPIPSAVEKQRREDRVTFSQLQYNPDALKRVRRAMGTRQVDEGEFHTIIKDAGIILSDRDTHLLFRRVSSRDGKAGLEAVESVLKPLEHVVAPPECESVLGFGTGSKLQKTKGRTSKFKGSFGQEDPVLRGIYSKVSTSSMGNPNRLRQLFRKYDVDKNGLVSKDEFLSALLSHNVPISREECNFLAQIADIEDRGVIKYEAFINVVSAVGGRGDSRPKTAKDGSMLFSERSCDSVNSSKAGAGRALTFGRMGVSRESSVASIRSISSVRSERSRASFAGSTSSFAGSVTRERSNFLLDGSLRDQERRANRSTAIDVPIASRTPQVAPAPQQQSGIKILHLATPAPLPADL